MKSLTDEALNIAICEWRGWKRERKNLYNYQGEQDYWRSPNGTTEVMGNWSLPSHITGIEALSNMHEAEKGLTFDQQVKFAGFLERNCQQGTIPTPMRFALAHATARQRAIALLRVVKSEIFTEPAREAMVLGEDGKPTGEVY